MKPNNLRDRIAEIIFYAIKEGAEIYDYPSTRWQDHHDLICSKTADKILSLIDKYYLPKEGGYHDVDEFYKE